MKIVKRIAWERRVAIELKSSVDSVDGREKNVDTKVERSEKRSESESVSTARIYRTCIAL